MSHLHYYIIAALLVILWAIGFFLFNAGLIIHVLLFVAFLTVILRLLKGNRSGKHPSFKPMQISIRK